MTSPRPPSTQRFTDPSSWLNVVCASGAIDFRPDEREMLLRTLEQVIFVLGGVPWCPEDIQLPRPEPTSEKEECRDFLTVASDSGECVTQGHQTGK